MGLLRPVPRSISRVLTVVVLGAWLFQMATLVRATYARSTAGLAGDLAKYGTTAQWKGIYYRGEKIGFSVSETLPTDGGYEIQDETQIRMAVLGSSSAARIRTNVQVDSEFHLRAFTFSLDPGTGPITIDGRLDGSRLKLAIETAGGRREETRDLPEPPSLALNLPRRLAAQGLEPGKRFEVTVFDPATMRNAPMLVEVQQRELVRGAGRPIPAFRVQTRFSGITALTWITDVGEVLREESPTGFMVVREPRETAMALAVPGAVQADLLEAVAIKPQLRQRIPDPRAVERLHIRLEGMDLESPDIDGVGQRKIGRDELELTLSNASPAEAADPEASRHLAPEPLVESDAPQIIEEARKAVDGATTALQKAERLTRYVNALLEKKPTVSLPSALEVLRTRVGDCNEHTALYVAMARAAGLPSRIAVGLVYMRGAFYYHAWPEVYVAQNGGGRWLAADPTLNEFPADATHIRLARGGLDKQAAILPLIGRGKITVLDMTLDKNFQPVLVGADNAASESFAIPLPRRTGSARSCWSRPGF